MPNLSASRGHLFIVSRAGQVNNARRVIAQLSLTNCTFVILYPRRAVQTVESIGNTIAEAGFPFETIPLPPYAHLTYPWQIRPIRHAYDNLARRFLGFSLWIANTHAHYGYLAQAFDKQKCKINYFEEGLGSYLKGDDARFLQRPHRSGHDVIAPLKDSRLSPLMRLRRSARYLVEFGLQRQLMAPIVTRKRDRFFRVAWTKFDQIVVSHPELLDPERFQSASSIVLRSESFNTALTGGTERRRFESLTGYPIYISQDYAINANDLGKAIGAALSEIGLNGISIKFHPHEPSGIQAALSQALIRNGIMAHCPTDFDEYSAEMLYRHLAPIEVIGLTSTSLLRIAGMESAAHVKSIGPSVIRYLKADSDVPLDRLHILERDCEALTRVSAAANLDITFC